MPRRAPKSTKSPKNAAATKTMIKPRVRTPRVATTPRTPRAQRTQRTPKSPKAAVSDVVKVISHRLYNQFYVLYTAEKSDGTKVEGTEFELREHMRHLDQYRNELTKQVNAEGEYEVKKIMAHRLAVRNGKLDPLYLVQWKNYENPVWFTEMWEEELENNKKLLEEYGAAPFETK